MNAMEHLLGVCVRLQCLQSAEAEVSTAGLQGGGGSGVCCGQHRRPDQQPAAQHALCECSPGAACCECLLFPLSFIGNRCALVDDQACLRSRLHNMQTLC